jgi:hypothetical protein
MTAIRAKEIRLERASYARKIDTHWGGCLILPYPNLLSFFYLLVDDKCHCRPYSKRVTGGPMTTISLAQKKVLLLQ